MLLDSDINKKTILEKDRHGQLPINISRQTNAPNEVIQLLLDTANDKKLILRMTNKNGKLPIDYACQVGGPIEVLERMSMMDDLEKKEADFMQEQNNLDRLTQSVTSCTVCLEENIPVLAENTRCGHRLCKKCALEMEWGDKKHAEHPTNRICLFVSGVCPECRRGWQVHECDYRW